MGDYRDDIQRAKQLLPLQDLLRHYGLGHLVASQGPSPFRDGDNQTAFGIFEKDNGEWNWKDFVTGEFGDEIDFIMRREGRSAEDARIKYLELAGIRRNGAGTDAPIEIKRTPGMTPKLGRRCEAEGGGAGGPGQGPAPTAVPFDWAACVEAVTDEKIAEIAAWRGYSTEFVETLWSNALIGLFQPWLPGSNPSVAFPVYREEQVIGCHYRLDAHNAALFTQSEAARGKKRVFEAGSWMYSKGTSALPLVIGDPTTAPEIYVFESQWDALAVADRLGWHEGRTEAAFIVTRGASNGALVHGLLGPGRVVVFPQNDEPKKDGKIPAEEWFTEVVKAAEPHKVLRLQMPTAHKDANDWTRAGLDEIELLKAISSARKPRSSSLPAMEDMSAIIGVNLPPKPPELVRGLLHQGSKIIIGGTSKGRKTFSLLDLALSIQGGVPWWGHECVQGRVCYINFEIQRPFFAQRIHDIAQAKKICVAPGMLMGWNLRGYVGGIEKMVDDIISELMDEKFVLIIFDPIYKALGDRDENKAGDVASMLNELESIAVKTGAAVAFGAHYSKGNQAAKESIDRIGGSGVFARDPDSILTMTPHEEENCFTVDATLRNFAPRDPFVVQWQWPLFSPVDLDPTAIKQPVKRGMGKGSEKREKPDLSSCLQTILGKGPLNKADLVRRIEEITGMSKPSAYRIIKQGEETRKIFFDKAQGKFYFCVSSAAALKDEAA